MIKKFSPSTLLILFALSFPVLAQDSEEDVTDFGSPNQTELHPRLISNGGR